MTDISSDKENVLKEATPGYGSAGGEAQSGGIDLSLLEDNLRLTPWERMLANDDALNFGDSLRAAMKKQHAKS